MECLNRKVLCIFFVIMLPTIVHSQTTKIENLLAQRGVLIVSGYTSVGELAAEYNASVSVGIEEDKGVLGKPLARGAMISVLKKSSMKIGVCYIDADEITPLLEAMDFMSKAEKSTSAMKTFRMNYRTVGGLKISAPSDLQEKIFVTVADGRESEIDFVLTAASFLQFRDLIGKAKASLDSTGGQK